MTTSLFHTVFQVAMVLALVVGLIFLLGWMAKKTQAFGLQGGKQMAILQTVPLGQKEKAVLIEVDGCKILLGVTSNQVSTLWTAPVISNSNLSESATTEKEYLSAVGVSGSDTDSKGAVNFSHYLKKIMSRDIAC